MNLTPRQRRFVAEYLVDLNSAPTVCRAGYSPKGRDVQRPRPMGSVGIYAEIQKFSSQHLEKLDISAQRVLAEMARLAFSNMLNCIEVRNGAPRCNLSRLTRDQAAAIASPLTEP